MTDARGELVGLVPPYFGALVRPPGRYRSWSRRGDTWSCVYTGDDLKAARRYGSITLPYPETPDGRPGGR